MILFPSLTIHYTEVLEMMKSVLIGISQGGSFGKGNGFETESALVDSFLENIELEEKLLEFETTNGIADLIIYSLRKDWESHAGIEEVEPRWAYALLCLPYRQSFSAFEFSGFSGASLKRSINALKQYQKAGFCKLLCGEKWIKKYQPRPVVKKICAVEAKISDWRRALFQAFRYYDFANESWVLMDSARVNRAIQNIEQFRRLNVGLLSITSEGELATHYSPAYMPHRSDLSFWYANVKIAKIQNQSR